MKRDLGGVRALVLHDNRSPVGILLLPAAMLTEELITAVREVAEEYDQFVHPVPRKDCRSLKEACLHVRELNGNHSPIQPRE